MLHRSLTHVTLLKWLASPLEFLSVSVKTLKDTGVSDKHKNTIKVPI